MMYVATPGTPGVFWRVNVSDMSSTFRYSVSKYVTKIGAATLLVVSFSVLRFYDMIFHLLPQTENDYRGTF